MTQNNLVEKHLKLLEAALPAAKKAFSQKDVETSVDRNLEIAGFHLQDIEKAKSFRQRLLLINKAIEWINRAKNWSVDYSNNKYRLSEIEELAKSCEQTKKFTQDKIKQIAAQDF